MIRWEKERQVKVRKIKPQHIKPVEDVVGTLITGEKAFVRIVVLVERPN